MEINSIPTEQTTAVTDLVLGLIATWGAIRVYQAGKVNAPQKARIWGWAFGLLAFAAFNGAINHGLVWDEAVYTYLWYPLNLALGMAIACFVMGVLYDRKQGPISKTPIGVLIGIGLSFFALSALVSGTFLVFVAYEALAMLFALTLYAGLGLRRQLAGASIIAFGIFSSMIAAAVQALGAGIIQFTVIWEFDHNGLFHIIQWLGTVLMAVGLLRSYKT